MLIIRRKIGADTMTHRVFGGVAFALSAFARVLVITRFAAISAVSVVGGKIRARSATIHKRRATHALALLTSLAISTSVVANAAMVVVLRGIDAGSHAFGESVGTATFAIPASVVSRTSAVTASAMLGVAQHIDALFATTGAGRCAWRNLAASCLTTRFVWAVRVFGATASIVDLAVAIVVFAVADLALRQDLVGAIPPFSVGLALHLSRATLPHVEGAERSCITTLGILCVAKHRTIGIISVGESIAIVVLAIAASCKRVFGGRNGGDAITPQKLLEWHGLGFLPARVAGTHFLLQLA